MRKVFLLFGLLLVGCAAKPNDVSAFSEALTITVLKPGIDQAVTQVSLNGFVVGFRLVCINASADTVIDKMFTEGFNLGNSVNKFRLRIGKKMQDEINSYQARHTIFDSAVFNATPAVLQAALDGGV